MTHHRVPRVSPVLLRWFAWYTARYLARHFNHLRLSRSSAALPQSGPLIVYLNHPSWWDPLVCLLLARKFFPGRKCFAPIDAESLARYRFFKKLGFFEVRRGPRAGADFLFAAVPALETEDSVLWITPQGRFADVRDQLQLRPGLGELMSRLPNVVAVPLAIEYAFWNERKPEVLVRFGNPIHAASAPKLTPEGWTTSLTASLERLQAGLAREVIARDEQSFESILRSNAGVAPTYDVWTKLRGLFSNQPSGLTPAHEAKCAN